MSHSADPSALRRLYRQRAAVFLQSLASEAPLPAGEEDGASRHVGGSGAAHLNLEALAEAGRALALRSLADTGAIDAWDAAAAATVGGGGGGGRGAENKEDPGGDPGGFVVAFPPCAAPPNASSSSSPTIPDAAEVAAAAVDSLASAASCVPPYAEEDCVCVCCGSLLRPGRTCSVAVRTLKRGRSRRRRASRAKARRLREEENAAAARGGGRAFSPSPSGREGGGGGPRMGAKMGHGEKAALAALQSSRRRLRSSLLNVSDGQFGNCAVYTCHRCGKAKKCGGADKVAVRERRSVAERERKGGEKKSMEAARRARVRSFGRGGTPEGPAAEARERKRKGRPEAAASCRPGNKRRESPAPDDLGGDFIALQPASTPAAAAASASFASTVSAAFTPKSTPQQSGGVRFGKSGVVTALPRSAPTRAAGAGRSLLDSSGKKRKKKSGREEGRKGSKLMDFLSSLND